MRTLDKVDAKPRARRPHPDMVIAYLKYAVSDVRALSANSTQLLEDAIAALVEDTAMNGNDVHGIRP